MSSSSSRITTNNRDEFHCREESFRKCNWLTWFLVLNLLAGNHLVLAYGSSCEDNEAHIQVDLIVSELSNGSGWSITDNEGLEHMGSCPGCTRLRRPTTYTIAHCISRSKCGGDGGDGRLTFAFEGTGYYESSAIRVDGDLAHFGKSDGRNAFSLHCPNESLPRHIPQQFWEHGVDVFINKVYTFTSIPHRLSQQLWKNGIDAFFDKVHEFHLSHHPFT